MSVADAIVLSLYLMPVGALGLLWLVGSFVRAVFFPPCNCRRPR